MEDKLIIDDLNKIRLIKPEFFDTSKKLAEQSSSFLKKYDEFHKYVDGINATIADIGSLADTERMKLLALKSELARPDNFAGEDKQQLHILITEKQRELDRLKVELQSLKDIESQQNEYIAICKKI